MLCQSQKNPEPRFVAYDFEEGRSRRHRPSEHDMNQQGEDKRESKVKVQIIRALSERISPGHRGISAEDWQTCHAFSVIS
jgi:hypothetical protein